MLRSTISTAPRKRKVGNVESNISSIPTDTEFYRMGLRGFKRAQRNGYAPLPPRGARGSRNALYLLAYGWTRGRTGSVGFIRCQFWFHKSVSEVCDTTGALYETRLARKTGKWENGDIFSFDGVPRPATPDTQEASRADA